MSQQSSHSDQKEANSRLIINKLLEQAGWQLTDNEHGKATVTVENHIVVDSKNQQALCNGTPDTTTYDQSVLTFYEF